MPFVKFSYPVGGHKTDKPVHVTEDKAAAYVRDGVAKVVEPPKVAAPAKRETPKQVEAKPAPKPQPKKLNE